MDEIATVAVTAMDGAAFGLMLFVVAAGLALMFGVMNVLNLAHGTLYLVGAYLAYLLTGSTLLGLAGALAAGIVVGGLGGAGLAVALRPLGTDQLRQALATIGFALIVADLYTTVSGGTPLAVHPPTVLSGQVTVLHHGYPVYRLVFIAVGATIAAGLHLLLRRTVAGIAVRAVVSQPLMAAATGLSPARVRAGALAVGGALAAAGGVLGAPLLGPAPGVDTTVLVLSLIVVVLGGTASIPAIAGSALLVGEVQTVGVQLAPAVAPFILAAVLLAALVLRGNRHPATTGRPA